MKVKFWSQAAFEQHKTSNKPGQHLSLGNSKTIFIFLSQALESEHFLAISNILHKVQYLTKLNGYD